jgi:hypothetical protein
MTTLFRAVSLSFLCLTFLATSASAEGAWVLWSQTLRTSLPPMESWSADATFETKADCEKKARAEWEKIKREREKFKKRVEELERSGGGGAPPAVRLKVVCLPATVDPREPKGK